MENRKRLGGYDLPLSSTCTNISDIGNSSTYPVFMLHNPVIDGKEVVHYGMRKLCFAQ